MFFTLGLAVLFVLVPAFLSNRGSVGAWASPLAFLAGSVTSWSCGESAANACWPFTAVHTPAAQTPASMCLHRDVACNPCVCNSAGLRRASWSRLDPQGCRKCCVRIRCVRVNKHMPSSCLLKYTFKLAPTTVSARFRSPAIVRVKHPWARAIWWQIALHRTLRLEHVHGCGHHCADEVEFGMLIQGVRLTIPVVIVQIAITLEPHGYATTITWIVSATIEAPLLW